jgi:SH3 domain protein
MNSRERSDQGAMVKKCLAGFFVVLSGLMLCSTSWAGRSYITDEFRVSLRRGPSEEHKILRFIPSGLPVETYETQEGWTRVRVTEGDDDIRDGWVLTRYLLNRLPWEAQAKSLAEENARLKEELARIDQTWADKIAKEQSLTKELKKNYETAQENVNRLSEENEILTTSRRSKWFTAGSLVLFSGLLVGRLIGKEPKRRRLSF